MKAWLGLLAPVVIAGVVWALMPEPFALRAGMALFTLIGAMWVTQGLPLAVTALAVPLLAALAGLLSPAKALASFAHPVIFLFLGGFALAAALSRHGIDRVVATAVLRLAGGRLMVAVILLSALSAVLSMWVSNTATATLMLPLALGLLHPQPGFTPGPREKTFVLLALAYSASIGGIGTVVGSPPNAIAAAEAGISFVEWMQLALPLVAILWPLMLVVLAVVLRPRLSGRVVLQDMPIIWSRDQWLTAAIFCLTVAAWVGSAPLARLFGVKADMDTLIALAAMVALAATQVITWADLERNTRWGVLVLFGGGLALSEVMASTGGSLYMAQGVLDAVGQFDRVLVVLLVLLFVVFLTELVSNTASAALLLPVMMSVAVPLGLPPVSVAAAIGIAASCAFMLPVATPPNAIVFASNEVPQAAMLRCGLVLNVVCTLVIAAMAAWMWP
jgi:sodium-dependent dicarboxylate transporter 2/3/5